MKAINNEIKKATETFDKASNGWLKLLQTCQDNYFEKCNEGLKSWQELVRFSLDCTEKGVNALRDTTIQNRQLLLDAYREVSNVC